MPPAPSRLEQLQAMLAKSPRDPFLLYGIAMEHKKTAALDKAIEYFEQTIVADPNYCYAYYQRGQTYELLNQPEQARRSYREGIEAARRAGDTHAAGELQAALDML